MIFEDEIMRQGPGDRGDLELHFVYRAAEPKHTWRFVWAGLATDNSHALNQAVAEARALGNDAAGGYMAVAETWIATREVVE